MRKSVIVLAAILIAAAAQAGVISDLQQGLYTEGDPVQVIGATVMGVTGNGAFITELPSGPYSGVWVYLGSGHTVLAGDIVDVQGVYEEYYDLTEINAGDGVYQVTGNGPLPTPYSLTAAEFAADTEAFEGVAICITDGFMVSEIRSYGEWVAHAIESDVDVVFDDFWFEAPTEDLLGACFDYACGCLTYSFGEYKLEAFADGITYVDCTVPTESSSLSEIKALFD